MGMPQSGIYMMMLFALPVLACQNLDDHPFVADSDLQGAPTIIGIALDSKDGVLLTLDRAYSEGASFLLERGIDGSFSGTPYMRVDPSTIRDESVDWSQEGVFEMTYRYSVAKDGLVSAMSREYAFRNPRVYLSAPESLQITPLELEGIRLDWNDRSGIETHYMLERDFGEGYSHLSILESNANSFVDDLASEFPLSSRVAYRVRAATEALESIWCSTDTLFSGLNAPTAFSITVLGTPGCPECPDSMLMFWSDNSDKEDWYTIEGREGNEFQIVWEVAQDNTSYQMEYVDGDRNCYRVKARSGQIYSFPSEELCIGRR